MLSFERLAGILETLRERLDLDANDINEIDILLSPIAAECEAYYKEMVARIDTYEICLDISAHGRGDLVEEFISEIDDEDDDE